MIFGANVIYLNVLQHEEAKLTLYYFINGVVEMLPA